MCVLSNCQRRGEALARWIAIILVVLGTTHVQAGGLESFRDFLFSKFHRHIHPHLRKAYEKYEDVAGDFVRERADSTFEFWTPKLQRLWENTHEYWAVKRPRSYNNLRNIPAPIKLAYEELIIAIWQKLFLDPSEEVLEGMNSHAGAAYLAKDIVITLNSYKFHAEQLRVDSLLLDLIPFAEDKSMAPCYEVHIMEVSFINAFNLGCRIFVTEELLQKMNDDEVRATLAHEMSHGDAGHSIKSLFSLLGSGFKHALRFSMDQNVWFWKGTKSDYLRQTEAEKHLPMIVEPVGKAAVNVEIEADQMAVRLLHKAGFSAEGLKSFLMKATAGRVVSGEVLRQYPSLEQRLEAISMAETQLIH